MRKYFDLVYSNTGTLQLFSHDHFTMGTLYGYRLCRDQHYNDYSDLHITEESFRTAAAARDHGLSKLNELARQSKEPMTK